MKVLVTGGAGFIGGHLVEELIKGEASIIVIDIELNPRSTFIHNKLDKKTELELVDIRDREKVLKVFTKYNPDYVFHLAAEPIVQEAYTNPHKAFETNIMGTVNVLEAVRINGRVKGIIVASSDKAYGKTKKAYTEDSPLKGDHPYDVSKSSADLICHAYYKTYNTPVVVTRFGNVYGEGDLHFGRIIPDICESVIKKKVLRIRSDGTYVRDYIYVKDVVDGYLFLLKNINRIKGEGFNFSSNDTLSVLGVVRKAEKILKKKVSYKILDIVKNEIQYQHLDDSKIRSMGWKHKYSLDKTFPRILEWYRSNF